jgi:tetratricopeptide (TPR) repeat protein
MALLLAAAALIGCQQPNDPQQAQLQREYNAAFQKTLDDPGNMDALLEYAKVATRTGDYEGAISALERTLLINPDLPQVQIELAVLYYRLRSYDMTNAYLQSALKSPTLTPALRKAAEQLMAKSQKRGPIGAT